VSIWLPALLTAVLSHVLLVGAHRPANFNEWVSLSANRLADVHTHSMVSKCWVKINQFPYWPALVSVRRPNPGSERAREALMAEENIFLNRLFSPPAKAMVKWMNVE
jgi:hypothetical protein